MDRDRLQVTRSLVDRMNRRTRAILRKKFPHLRGGGTAEADLQDVMQDAWVELLRPGGALERFDPSTTTLPGLLTLIARRRAVDQFRRANTKRRGGGTWANSHAGMLEDMQDKSVVGPEDRLIQEDLERWLHHDLTSELEDRDAVIFMMRWYDGCDVSEIAAALAMNGPNVYRRIDHIKEVAWVVILRLFGAATLTTPLPNSPPRSLPIVRKQLAETLDDPAS